MAKTHVVLPALPAMPSNKGKNKPLHDCACGCGGQTRGTWFPGHDGRATGWAVRIERGVIASIEDVPANERKGAAIMLARRERDRVATKVA